MWYALSEHYILKKLTGNSMHDELLLSDNLLLPWQTQLHVQLCWFQDSLIAATHRLYFIISLGDSYEANRNPHVSQVLSRDERWGSPNHAERPFCLGSCPFAQVSIRLSPAPTLQSRLCHLPEMWDQRCHCIAALNVPIAVNNLQSTLCILRHVWGATWGLRALTAVIMHSNMATETAGLKAGWFRSTGSSPISTGTATHSAYPRFPQAQGMGKSSLIWAATRIIRKCTATAAWYMFSPALCCCVAELHNKN
jgi:hypothetical protein